MLRPEPEEPEVLRPEPEEAEVRPEPEEVGVGVLRPEVFDFEL